LIFVSTLVDPHFENKNISLIHHVKQLRPPSSLSLAQKPRFRTSIFVPSKKGEAIEEGS
jgi:hypothetical protein